MSRIRRDDGAVLVLVALVLPVLLLLTAGGVSGFSLFSAQRELQRAADQAALAGASALPPFDPNVLVENAPYPLPGTSEVLTLIDSTGVEVPDLDAPRMRDLIPDPRSVSCAIGSSLLGESSAGIVNTFADVTETEAMTETVEETVDPERETVCEDTRVVPRMQPNPAAMTPVDCTNALVGQVAAEAGDLDIDLLDPVLAPVQETVDSIVRMPLNHLLPAAFTPRMKVTTYARIRPPLLSLITGGDAGTMSATAVAYRRIKNAVVVPILPSQRLLIDTGLADPVDVMTDPVNLNRALQTNQAKLIEAVDDADARLDGLMSSYGLPCSNLLHNLRQDLRDVYDPPSGPAPSAKDVVDSAVAAQEATAARVGAAAPDPTNPDSLAGEAFLLVGVTVDEQMNPVASTEIPILDAALVVMNHVSDGSVSCSEEPLTGLLDPGTVESCYHAAVVSAANAYGAFRATLVE